MKKKVFLLLAATSLAAYSMGQDISKVVNIKTPEVTAFEKYIEVPVSNYTGVPEISIPIYEIKIKDVSVPITLSYHAGGIRTDDEATWVGLGWSLNTGGQISRSVKGKPDEYSYIYGGTQQGSMYSIAHYLSLPNVHQDAWQTDREDFLRRCKSPATSDIHDLMPDEFYYSAPGYSGKFLFQQANNRFLTFPKENVVISPTLATPSGPSDIGVYSIPSWNLTMPNGVKINYGPAGSKAAIANSTVQIRNSWDIGTITNSYNETISYSYASDNYVTYKANREIFSWVNQSLSNGSIKYDNTSVHPTDIYFPTGSIHFVTISRDDLDEPALDEIQVKNSEGTIVKRVKFNYSYFLGNYGDLNYVSNNLTPDHNTKRLRLNSVSITNSGAQPLVYGFDYNTNFNLPSKNSAAQDFWGYFNGKSNTTMVPQMFYNQQYYGDRKVDPNYATAFSLKNITYPTGGKTEFSYESNSISTSYIPAQYAEMLGIQNLVMQSQHISIYGSKRDEFGNYNSSYHQGTDGPDSIGTQGEYYFIQRFSTTNTIRKDAFGNVGTWSCNSNFFQSGDLWGSCYGDNVYFRLIKTDLNGTRTIVNEFSVKDCSSSSQVLTQANNVPLNLEPLTNYEMQVVIYYNFNRNSNAAGLDLHGHSTGFYISWLDLPTSSQGPAYNSTYSYVGGVRVKEIKSYNQDGSMVSDKKYSYSDAAGLTSGKVITFPSYYQTFIMHEPGNTYANSSGNYFDVHIFSNPVVAMETTCGSSIGYQFVTEEQIGATPADNLKSDYSFSFQDGDHSNNYYNIIDGVMEAKEWNRGKLISAQHYKNGVPQVQEFYQYYEIAPNLTYNSDEDYVEAINTDWISARAIENGSNASDFYDMFTVPTPVNFDNNKFKDAKFLYSTDNYIVPDDILAALPPGATPGSSYMTHLPYYKRYTGFDKPKQKTTVVYDDGGSAITTTVNYYYDNTPSSFQLSRTESQNSKGEAIKTIIKYPSDFASVAPYGTMQQNNRMTEVVEKDEYNNGNPTQVTRTNYKDWGNSIITPETIQQSLMGGTLYNKLHFYDYDTYGNPLTASAENDVHYSYIWDYNGQLPIAKITGADKSDVAYTSFESTGPGSWGCLNTSSTNAAAITGTKSYNLSSGSICKQGLNGIKQYTVSYWSQGGQYTVTGSTAARQGLTLNGWTYYEHTVSGITSVSISGSGLIDELRLYPSNAEMETYTYTPLIGITASCDASNHISYYEYDALGRLIIIRDQNGNIVKRADYGIQSQD